MPQEITEQSTGRGIAFGFGSAVFHSPDNIPGLGGSSLRQAIRSTGETLGQLSADMLPERIGPRLMAISGGMLFTASRDAINIARREKSDAIAADARQLEPALAIDPAEAVETRRTVTGLDPAGATGWVERASLADLSAVVVGGNRAALPEPIFERARERFWLANWEVRHAAAATNPAEPSVETVLAVGPDAAAVRAEAESYLARHRERMAELDHMEGVAKSLVSFIAAIFGIGASEALDRIMGRTDAGAA